LYGAQIVGEKGVAKRIDVFATAIANEMTTEDITLLDLSCAPLLLLSGALFKPLREKRSKEGETSPFPNQKTACKALFLFSAIHNPFKSK
jgi:hypothetical protein